MRRITLLVIVAVAALSGCMSNRYIVTSTNPEQLAVSDTKPEGYPRSHIEKDGMNCTKYDEDYAPGLVVHGKKTWRKVTNINSLGVACPTKE